MYHYRYNRHRSLRQTLRRLFHTQTKISTESAARELDQNLLELAKLSSEEIYKKFQTSAKGLSGSAAHLRLLRYGPNEVVKERNIIWPIILLRNLRDPLSILLIVLVLLSFLTKDIKATAMISVMVILSVSIRFFQELRAGTAAKKLKAMVRTTAHVIRQHGEKEIPLNHLVPGDIVHLSAGDMIPADLRLVSSKDLYINQATLTGEALPVEKHADTANPGLKNPMEMENLCFLGTNVESGSGLGVIIASGTKTYLGTLAKGLTDEEPPTSFQIGVKKITWLFIKIILICSPAVFIINGLGKGNWFESFFFALAVAIGLAPEMLPVIFTVNLSRGAVDMSKKKVIVKHLESVQNFGAMDILCTDKTGTITEGRVVLEKYLDLAGRESPDVLHYAYLNSYFQTGLNNLLDAAILKHKELEKILSVKKNYKKIDEIPFDFSRRRMSVVVEDKQNDCFLFCKGAVEEILSVCDSVQIGGETIPLGEALTKYKTTTEDELNEDGLRVVAVAYKKIEQRPHRVYSIADEKNLTLVGFLAFLDPPKASAAVAIKELEKYGVAIKIMTGDNELVTKKICSQVGLPTDKILLGPEMNSMDDNTLAELAEKTIIFAKLLPVQKERLIKLLMKKGHAVGFLGDGINDAPALRAADVGVSVDTAADIAKESSDIILLEKSLLVLKDGMLQGRKIFGNIVKYIEMAASSNFGNMFSVVLASFLLPFLPMLPIQILVNNLLYDISQTAIPTDRVDPEYLEKPRRWDIKLIRNFIIFIGPMSSIFDLLTYFVMLFIFNAWANPALFQTGWFVESLISQTLIIHIIRTKKIPFIQSRASWPLTFMTFLVIGIGIYLPLSPLAGYLGFTRLPAFYWAILLAMMVAYFAVTQAVKVWFYKKFKTE
jgi:Mg2+-importing ATPase